jgi:cytochrome c553
VVAFLLRLPDLNTAEYARLARGAGQHASNSAPVAALASLSPLAQRMVSQNCVHCHGADGLGRGGASPVLAGQKPVYLFASLDAYARGARHSGIMKPAAAALDRATMNELAQYYARLAPPDGQGQAAPNAPSIARGRQLAQTGLPREKVPPCAECHGPNQRRRNPIYPELAGQHAEYLVQQLALFKAGKRGGTSYAHLMEHVAPHLTEEQIRDVAAYYASLRRPLTG